eukprot:gene6183-9467_t
MSHKSWIGGDEVSLSASGSTQPQASCSKKPLMEEPLCASDEEDDLRHADKGDESQSLGKTSSSDDSAKNEKACELQQVLESMAKNNPDAVWFTRHFPHLEDEEVKAIFKCTYVDDSPPEHVGKLCITDGGLCFFSDKALPRERIIFEIPHETILNVDLEGRPRHLTLYDTDRRVYKFRNFKVTHRHQAKDVNDPLLAARNCAFLWWRKATELPNGISPTGSNPSRNA